MTAEAPTETDRGHGIYRSAEAQRAVFAEYDRLADAWPIERRELDVTTDVGTMHVIDSGPVDGTPVVLLHASSMGAISWAENVAALAEAGFRTYALDHPGEANRSVLDDPGRFPGDDAAVARIYDEALDQLHLDRCDVVGASAGAQRALRFALAHPDRVRRLGLIGPMGLTPLHAGAIVRMMLASLRPTPRRIRSTAKWALGKAPAVLERYERWFELAVLSVEPPPRVSRPTSTPRRLLRTLAAPTLVVVGDHDHLAGPAPRVVRRAAVIPDCTIRILPSSHLVNVEQAEEVDRLLLHHLRR